MKLKCMLISKNTNKSVMWTENSAQSVPGLLLSITEVNDIKSQGPEAYFKIDVIPCHLHWTTQDYYE